VGLDRVRGDADRRIYGMNFRHMPELQWYFGYPFALGTMAVLSFVLYRVFRRRGWL